MVVFFSLSDRKFSKMFSWAQILLISILHYHAGDFYAGH